MPSKNGFRRNNGSDLAEHVPAKDLALNCETSAFIVAEPNALALELIPQDSVLLLVSAGGQNGSPALLVMADLAGCTG
ncbi:MAG: hypothetical protein JSU63_17245 [Phycisphaerales bacterium]|nr:MAG: hypothetical protein JSU63_17245 [Phycisphaerales bacterium]